MTLKTIEKAARKLSTKQKSQLAAILLSTLDSDETIEREWIEEAERRYRAYVSGRTKGRSWDEVITSARARLRQ
jgi:hypothetical protein